MSDRDGNPTKEVWKVSPTPETVSTNVSGILGECHSFCDEEEEGGRPIILIDEQDDHSESAHKVFVAFVAGADVKVIAGRGLLECVQACWTGRAQLFNFRVESNQQVRVQRLPC